MQPANIWVIKCREYRPDGSYGWHWRYYFPGEDCAYKSNSKARRWGGQKWIESSASKKFIRESVQAGDIVVCYQTDHREIVGLTLMASSGLQDPPKSGDFNCFDLAPPVEAFAFDQTLSVADLRAAACSPECFGIGKQGTIFPVDTHEFQTLVQIVINQSPGARKGLERWLRNAGWKRPRRSRAMPV